MFCPKCGCLLPDGSSVCNECGHRIGRRIRKDLLQEQPPEKQDVRESKTLTASRYGMGSAVGLVACAAICLSAFLVWASPGYTGVELVLDRPISGSGSGLLNAACIFAVVAAIFAGYLIYEDSHTIAIMPLGIVIAVVAVMFGVEIVHHGMEAGAGTYITAVCGMIVAVLGLSRSLP